MRPIAETAIVSATTRRRFCDSPGCGLSLPHVAAPVLIRKIDAHASAHRRRQLVRECDHRLDLYRVADDYGLPGPQKRTDRRLIPNLVDG